MEMSFLLSLVFENVFIFNLCVYIHVCLCVIYVTIRDRLLFYKNTNTLSVRNIFVRGGFDRNSVIFDQNFLSIFE